MKIRTTKSMSDITSIYLFYCDPAFINHETMNFLVLENTGISKLNQLGLSYFVDLYIIRDQRQKNERPIDWAATTSPSIYIDQHWYKEFINFITDESVDCLKSVYTIIDRLLFNKSSDTDDEKYFTTTDKIKDIYVPGSIKDPAASVEDDYYVDGNPVHYKTSPSKIFRIKIRKGDMIKTYELNVFIDGESWRVHYPNTLIQKVSPPVSYNDLLYMDFIREMGNKLNVATDTSSLIGTNIIPGYVPTDIPSGYLNFKTVIKDKAGNEAPVVFTLIYKGALPSQQQIRDAIKDALIHSGVGDENQWKDRIPSLFIDNTFFIVPMWDNILEQSDKILHPSSLTLNKSLQTCQIVLPFVDAFILNNRVDIIVSAYEKMFHLAVPSIDTIDDYDKARMFHEILPDYQLWASTEPNFNYMNSNSQEFSKHLTAVLVMLNENKPNPLYNIITDKGVDYVSFTIEKTEYCVITPHYYAEAIRG